MDSDNRLRIFNTISTFVQDLNVGFGKKYKPVALYNRLLENTTIRNVTAMDRHIKAFRTFFNNNENYITKKVLGEDARIMYSDRIYIDIGRILSKLDDAGKIHKHLLTIYALLNLGTKNSSEAIQLLQKSAPVEQLDLPKTAEGNFIQEMVSDMMQHLPTADPEKTQDPMDMLKNVVQSDFFPKFIGNLQTKLNNKEMNVQSLMSTVMGVMGTLQNDIPIPAKEAPEKIEKNDKKEQAEIEVPTESEKDDSNEESNLKKKYN